MGWNMFPSARIRKAVTLHEPRVPNQSRSIVLEKKSKAASICLGDLKRSVIVDILFILSKAEDFRFFSDEMIRTAEFCKGGRTEMGRKESES